MDGWIIGQVEGWRDRHRWMVGLMIGWVDRLVDEKIYRKREGWEDKWLDIWGDW